jgi:hypothetical protein
MTDINPLNAVRGPARIWVATLGATEPAATNAALVADPDSSVWTFVGATQGGCTWEEDQTITDIEADQVVDPIGGRVTKRKIAINFSMLEATLANFAVALNRFGTTTVGTGITTYSPGQMTSGSIPTYSAVLVDGQAPQVPGGGQARRRAIFRKVMNNNAKVSQTYDPAKDDLIPVTFQGYYISPTIDPYFVMDQTA